jgi:hypothetical protein
LIPGGRVVREVLGPAREHLQNAGTTMLAPMLGNVCATDGCVIRIFSPTGAHLGAAVGLQRITAVLTSPEMDGKAGSWHEIESFTRWFSV